VIRRPRLAPRRRAGGWRRRASCIPSREETRDVGARSPPFTAGRRRERRTRRDRGPTRRDLLSRLVDLSLEGARLEVDRPIGVGTPLRLGLVLGGELVRSPGRIRWSGPTRSGPRAFAHGVALVDTAWEAREVIRSFLIERLLVGESS